MSPHPITITRVAIHLASLVGVLVGCMFTFVVAVVFQTMYPSPPPLVFEEGHAVAFSDEDDTVVLYLRPFTATRDENVALERSVICNVHGGEAVFDLPQYLRQYRSGERVAQQRVVLYPAALPVGTQCNLATDVKWSPTFSMNWHVEKLPPIHFAIARKGDFKAFQESRL
jgi:hypothetical protein